MNLNENCPHFYLLNSKLSPVKRMHPQKSCFFMRVGLQRGSWRKYVPFPSDTGIYRLKHGIRNSACLLFCYFLYVPVVMVMLMIKTGLETACFAIFESVPVRFGLQEYVYDKNWHCNDKFGNF